MSPFSSIITQSANIGTQDVPATLSSNVPKTYPKDPIWSSWGHPDMTSRRRHDLTSWGRHDITPMGRPEITSRGCPNLTFKLHPWEVDSRHPQDVLRASPRELSKHSNLGIPNFLLIFLSELVWLTKFIKKHFNTQGILRTQSNF